MINPVSLNSYYSVNNAQKTGNNAVLTTEQNPVCQTKNSNTVNSAYPANYYMQDLTADKKNDIFTVFDKIKDKVGKDFAQAAYHELVKYYGLEKSAPSDITWEKNEGRPIIGDYRFYDNSIVFYTDYFLKQSKAEQLATIAHELTHCKQLVNMLTTEGISVEQVAYSYAVSDMRAMLVRNPKVIAMYNQAKQNGKEKEFMQMMIQVGTKKTANELRQAHAQTLQLPKHPLNSPEGKEAQNALIAQFNYNGADMDSYNKCPLEKQAKDIENAVRNAYYLYLNNKK